jgi:hypothetical protein
MASARPQGLTPLKENTAAYVGAKVRTLVTCLFPQAVKSQRRARSSMGLAGQTGTGRILIRRMVSGLASAGRADLLP